MSADGGFGSDSPIIDRLTRWLAAYLWSWVPLGRPAQLRYRLRAWQAASKTQLRRTTLLAGGTRRQLPKSCLWQPKEQARAFHFPVDTFCVVKWRGIAGRYVTIRT